MGALVPLLLAAGLTPQGYVEIVEGFWRGEPERLEELLAEPDHDVNARVRELIREDVSPRATSELRIAAALVHTTLWVRDTLQAPPGSERLYRTARALLRGDHAEIRRARAAWLLFVGRWRQRLGHAWLAETAFKERLALLPDDPKALQALGAHLEALASIGFRGYERDLAPPPALNPMLARAEGYLRRASQLRPEGREAALRLARIHQLQRKTDTAAREYAALAADANAPDEVRSLARLFLGGLHEAAGRPDAALGEYRMAAQLQPGAQTPQVALSWVLRRAGRDTESQAALERVLLRSQVSDPWWAYRMGWLEHPGDVAAMLQGLRQDLEAALR